MQKSILVVDDQPGIRLLLVEVLKNEGYRVATAETGKEALDQLFQKTFDLLMLDYKLPVIDGSEVIRRLKQENISVPAIIMSGLAEEVTKKFADYPNVKEVISKPFNITDICSITNGIIGQGK
ncbi:response regulator [Lentibacillus sp. L22]|uniref:response regulator n=1 Tax=Lentibacillus TaxID=175304 RepID=UPI0022B0AAE6|nr:response regulator [Lentibacillus daqui]